jgi:DNA-binding NarL/FixJ family response regulator
MDFSTKIRYDRVMISVTIVDDHPIVRAGMRAVLDTATDIEVLGEGACGAEALSLVDQLAPDVLVLDLNLPDINGLDITQQLSKKALSTAILILTAHDEPEMVFSLLENGAIGYVLKDEALETLPGAVRAAARGESWLSPTVASQVVQRAVQREAVPAAEAEISSPAESPLSPREMEILKLISQGLDNTAIAETLMVTKRTVQNHISNIYGKLGVTSRTEAMLFALRCGWSQVHSSKEQANDA